MDAPCLNSEQERDHARIGKPKKAKKRNLSAEGKLAIPVGVALRHWKAANPEASEEDVAKQRERIRQPAGAPGIVREGKPCMDLAQRSRLAAHDLCRGRATGLPMSMKEATCVWKRLRHRQSSASALLSPGVIRPLPNSSIAQLATVAMLLPLRLQ